MFKIRKKILKLLEISYFKHMKQLINKADLYYKENLSQILSNGSLDKNPRAKYKDGTPAHSKFITSVFEIYDIAKGEFPIPTLRNTAIKTGIKEIFWIYQKQSNSLQDAHDLGINWWDEWDIGDGTIGNRYGYVVKKYNLIGELLSGLISNPFGRRHIITLYQYEDLRSSKGLDPCAYETLWSVRSEGKELILDMTLIQRSNDYLVSGYINKIQYVALQMMVARHCSMKVGKFNHYVNNLHIYDRHYDAANEVLLRDSLELQPSIKLDNKNNSFYNFNIENFSIHNIENIQKIKSPLDLAI